MAFPTPGWDPFTMVTLAATIEGTGVTIDLDVTVEDALTLADEITRACRVVLEGGAA